MTAHAWAERLASGAAIDAPLALVVAHPDDETLWTGAALARMKRLRLILLTDGAPRRMDDAERLGFATRDAYAAARRAEFDAALTALEADAEVLRYELVDQEVMFALPALTARLAQDLDGMAAVVTHPYEGGHPDHDGAALAVTLAVGSLEEPPAHAEFACYHKHEGARRFGAFWPHPDSPEQTLPLDPAARARIDSAIAAHATQAEVIGDWRPEAERWRAAPAYDFAAPPPPGEALYDGYGWTMISARWRGLAAEALNGAAA